MSHIPTRLAWRIDRLAGRAHRFHRFAHHPLCGAYAEEVLHAGRMRLCRGCTFVGLGASLGFTLGWLAPVAPPGILCMVALSTLVWVVLVFGTTWPRRLGKVGTRLLPSLLAACLGVQGFRSGSVPGLLLALGCLAALPVAVRAYRRRGPWRGPCATCPDREGQPCPGFRPQLRRERAFRRVAARMLASGQTDPTGL